MTTAAGAIIQAVLEAVAYPILYALGLVIVKLFSLGRARVLPLGDRGYWNEMRWFQFFLRRAGVTFWIPESVALVGGCATLLLGIGGFLLWRHG